jgi:hypothetical protein
VNRAFRDATGICAIEAWCGQTGAVLSNGENPSAKNLQTVGQPPPGGEHDQHSQLSAWQRRLVLCALLIAFVASFFAYARRSVDFAGYAAVGKAFFDGRDIYLDTPAGANTWPPFFSLAAVPLGLLDRVSPYLAHIVWIALTWASILWALDLIARLIYGKRLRFRPDETSLAITSPELLVPFALTLPFLINNFELLQINMILFALALWGLYLQANGREAAGGIALAAAAAMKVMAIAFLPYLLYRKRWRPAFWLAAASVFFFFSPALFLGWAKFWQGVALWPVALRASWGAGNAHQSVYSMWDRVLGYGYIPFAVPGTFILPLSGARSAKLAWELTCAVVAVLAVIACRGTPRPGSRWAQIEWAIVFVAATILSPLTRKPYLVVLLLPYALLYAAWRSADLDARTRRVLRNVMFVSFALSVPTMHDVIGKSLAVRLEMGSIVTYGSLIMLGGLLWYRSRAPQETS